MSCQSLDYNLEKRAQGWNCKTIGQTQKCSFAWRLGRSFSRGRQLANRLPTNGQESTKSRPIDGQQSANCRPRDGRQKAVHSGAVFQFFLTLLIRYYVNRDTLFSYHKASEVFLQRLMALYVASHYKVIAIFGVP